MASGQSQSWVTGSISTQSGTAQLEQMELVRVTVGQPVCVEEEEEAGVAVTAGDEPSAREEDDDEELPVVIVVRGLVTAAFAMAEL